MRIVCGISFAATAHSGDQYVRAFNNLGQRSSAGSEAATAHTGFSHGGAKRKYARNGAHATEHLHDDATGPLRGRATTKKGGLHKRRLTRVVQGYHRGPTYIIADPHI